ncbi:MAG: ABC transporter permease [Rhodospirillaceae bacterium]|nr:ABC transporter permease [Rhodospirillaceae bacterium]
MSPLARAVWTVVVALFVLFLLSPLALVVLFSFTGRAMMNFPMEGLSLQWWRGMIDNPKFWPAFYNSLIVSGVAGAVSAVVGTAAALGFARLPARRSNLAIAVLCLPLMLPPLVLAVSLLSFYVSVGFRLSLATVILSHLLFTQPFVVMVVYARMTTFDWRVVESARDLGASPFTAFRTVTLPVIQPTVIGAALIAVALSIDDFIITFFTIGGGNTLPTFVWGMIRTALTPTVNAIGTLIILITIGSTLLGLWLTRYRG